MASLPPASAEQAAAVEVLRGRHCLVQAVAGAGKTTAALHFARDKAPLPALLLTYSARLRYETRSRAKALGVDNLEVHSLHSFAVKYLDPRAKRDGPIIEFIEGARDGTAAPRRPVPAYALVIVDEAQDLTLLYMRLVALVLRLCSCSAGATIGGACPRVCFMGDARQSIYRFKASDGRFLTLAPWLLRSVCGDPETGWGHARLSRSYRCSPAICEFLNQVVLREPGAIVSAIRSAATGATDGQMQVGVHYLRCNVMRSLRDPRSEILYSVSALIKRWGPEGVFVLSPSVRSTNPHAPLNRLCNFLTRAGVPLCKTDTDSDAGTLDEEVMRGKLAVVTYHQSKGLERDAVVLMGADASYLTYFARDEDPSRCPNTLYVAITRAKKELLVVQDADPGPLPFLDVAALRAGSWAWRTSGLDARFRPLPPAVATKPPKPIGVRELLSYLSSERLARARACLDVRVLRPPGDRIELPTKLRQSGSDLVESVGEISGVAIPAALELRRTGDMQIRRGVGGKTLGRRRATISPPDLLKMATRYVALRSGVSWKRVQIQDFDWIDKPTLERCVARLADIVPDDAVFEAELRRWPPAVQGLPVQQRKHHRDILGYADVVTPSSIIEIKCISGDLADEHILQAAVYAFLAGSDKQTLVFNVFSGELLEVVATPGQLEAMINELHDDEEDDEHDEEDDVFVEAGSVAVDATALGSGQGRQGGSAVRGGSGSDDGGVSDGHCGEPDDRFPFSDEAIGSCDDDDDHSGVRASMECMFIDV